MTIATQMKQIALDVANHLQMRAHDAKQERFTTMTRKAEIDAQLEQAKLTYNRAVGFEPQIHGNLQCPRCWVANGTRSVLTPTQGSSDSKDFFGCPICEIKISLQSEKG
jgi:hypothetical protein